jgi:bifunctional oligoribonuclease and PAP phosphatase NrnA
MMDPSPAERIATALLAHPGPFVIVAHVDPDGDALASVLTLARALRQLGREALAPMADPPRYLQFLHAPAELSPPLERLPADALLVVVDCPPSRVAGAPADQLPLVNIDHHASNDGRLGVSWVDPSYAAAALMVVEVVDALGVPWDPQMATGALTGILTDTGHLRFANTDHRALTVAARLLGFGVDYGDLTDRLQYRHPDHYRMLGMVLGDGPLAPRRVADPSGAHAGHARSHRGERG